MGTGRRGDNSRRGLTMADAGRQWQTRAGTGRSVRALADGGGENSRRGRTLADAGGNWQTRADIGRRGGGGGL